MKAGKKAGKAVKKGTEKVKKIVKVNFWRKTALCFNPKKYKDIAGAKIKSGFGYLSILLAAAIIIMALISIPTMFGVNAAIKEEIDKFSTLVIDAQVETTEPIKIGGKDPQVVIDTSGTQVSMGREKLLVTGDLLLYRPYGRQEEINLSAVKDIKSVRDSAANLMTFLMILVLPSILIVTYVLFWIKYAATILVVSLLLFLILRIAKKDLSFKRSFNTALYAATPMIILEVLFIPFNTKYLFPLFQILGLNFYLITLLLYFVFLGFCAAYARKGPAKKSDYVTVEKIEWEF